MRYTECDITPVTGPLRRYPLHVPRFLYVIFEEPTSLFLRTLLVQIRHWISYLFTKGLLLSRFVEGVLSLRGPIGKFGPRTLKISGNTYTSFILSYKTHTVLQIKTH